MVGVDVVEMGAGGIAGIEALIRGDLPAAFLMLGIAALGAKGIKGDVSALNKLDALEDILDVKTLTNISKLDNSILSKIDVDALKKMDPYLLSKINPKILNNLNPKVVNSLSLEEIVDLDWDALAKLDKKVLKSLTAKDLIKKDKLLDLINDIDPTKLTNNQKGIYGEAVTLYHSLNLKNYTTVDGDKFNLTLSKIIGPDGLDLNRKIDKGIDFLFENSTPPPKYVVVESKYGTSTMNKTKYKGRQMSKEWIIDSLMEADYTEEMANEIFNNSISLLSKVDVEGNAVFKELNDLGYIKR